MTRFSIDVVRHGRKWCTVIIEAADPEGVMKDVLSRFNPAQGYQCSMWRERETRRIVEVTDQARIIGTSHARQPVSAEDLLGTDAVSRGASAPGQ